jgi:hypothetical protein
VTLTIESTQHFYSPPNFEEDHMATLGINRNLPGYPGQNKMCISTIFTLALLSTGTASAQGLWSEPDQRSCTQITGCGTAMWRPPMLRTEFGISHLRTRFAADSPSTGTLTASGDITAQMYAFRFLGGYAGYYLATDISFGRIDPGRLVVIPSSSGKTIDPEDRVSVGNFAVTATVGPGREIRYGRLALGAELLLGVGVLTIGGERLDSPWVTDARFLLNANARVGVWLTRNISLMGNVGASLVRSDEHMFGLMLGFTPLPYDGL